MTTSQQVLLGMLRPSSFTFSAPSGGSGSSYSLSTVPVNSGETISFISTTTGATAWLWNFGNGVTSTLQNPTYAYPAGGSFTPTLTASAASGLVVFGQARSSIVAASVGPLATITFEDISGSAPNGGSPIGTNYTAATGVTFPATMSVFNRLTDSGTTPPANTGYNGYARKTSGVAADITVDPARNYNKLIVDIGVGIQICSIYVYDAFNNVLNSGLHDFANSPSGRAWTYNYTLADSTIVSSGFPIARISVQHNALFWCAVANIRLYR